MAAKGTIRPLDAALLKDGSTAEEQAMEGVTAAEMAMPGEDVAPGAGYYRMKPYAVRAFRWDGTTAGAEAAAKAMPLLRVVIIRDPHPLSLRPPTILLNLPGPAGKKTMQIREAGWVIRGPTGGCFFATDGEFADIYEPDPPGARA